MYTKTELINKIWGLENKYSLQAIEELRVRGWLSDGSLRGVALCQAQLQDANLMEADLCNADFHQATLDYADLRKARLNGAKFNRASLQNVNFDMADLNYVEMYKVNLRGARNLTEQQLSKTNQLLGSIMPDGKPYDGRYNLPGDLGRARWAKVDVNDPAAMANFYGVSLDVYLAGQKNAVLATSLA
ncbi:MAG: pentapeptide repeat-containing protein [Anaerolineales bacterium]